MIANPICPKCYSKNIHFSATIENDNSYIMECFNCGEYIDTLNKVITPIALINEN